MWKKCCWFHFQVEVPWVNVQDPVTCHCSLALVVTSATLKSSPMRHHRRLHQRSQLDTTHNMAEVQSPPAQTALATTDASLETVVQSPPAQTALAPPDISLEPATSTEQTIITTNAETGKRVKKIIRRKRRPARPQVDPATFKTDAPPPVRGYLLDFFYHTANNIFRLALYTTCGLISGGKFILTRGCQNETDTFTLEPSQKCSGFF